MYLLIHELVDRARHQADRPLGSTQFAGGKQTEKQREDQFHGCSEEPRSVRMLACFGMKFYEKK
jgi:hypothetical protein